MVFSYVLEGTKKNITVPYEEIEMVCFVHNDGEYKLQLFFILKVNGTVLQISL